MNAPALNTPMLAERFASRFRGLDRAYGIYTPAKTKERGSLKLEGKAETVQAPVTHELYVRHLSGEQGLGIVPITDDSTCWFGAIDIDHYDGLDFAKLQAKCVQLELPLLACESKSGGCHLFFFASEPVPAKLLQQKLKAWAKVLGYPKAEIFPKQVELKKGSKGSWINLPYFCETRPALRNGEPITLEKFLDLADAVAATEADLRELTVAVPKPSAVGPVPENITEERNITLWNAGCRLRGKGYEHEAILAELLALNERCDPPLRESEVQGIADRAAKYEVGASSSDADEAIAELNQTYAIVQVGDKVRVLQEQGRLEFTLLPRNEFRALLSNRFCEDGGNLEPVAEVWLRSLHRRQFSKIVFEPGQHHTAGAYNLFRGWAVQPRPGDCSLFLEHLRENVCQGDEALYHWVLGWFAHLFQRPSDKLGTALVFRGRQGTGKSIVGKIVGHLLEPHYTVAASAHQVTGHFNAHLERCLLLHAEEAFWAGDKAAEGALKDRITNDTMMLERKGIDAFPIANHLRLLVCSNAHWVVPAGLEERRFAVLDVGEGRIQDTEYFGRVVGQMESGGYEALMHHLLTFDFTTANLRAIPATAALREQKVSSLPAEYKWWLDVLMSGSLPADLHGTGECAKSALHHDYCMKAQRLGYQRRQSETELGELLHKMVPGLGQGRHAGPNGARYRTYRFPSLDECRAEFDRVMKQRTDWGQEGQEITEWQRGGDDGSGQRI